MATLDEDDCLVPLSILTKLLWQNTYSSYDHEMCSGEVKLERVSYCQNNFLQGQ